MNELPDCFVKVWDPHYYDLWRVMFVLNSSIYYLENRMLC